MEIGVTASDPEGEALTFKLLSNLAWLTIDNSGLISGTPPTGSAGTEAVQVEVSDSKLEKVTQSFQLKIRASFEGCQAIEFDLSTESELALIDADPDGDLIPNGLEYALDLDPKTKDQTPLSDLSTDSDRITFTLEMRNDDPDLTLQAEFAGSVPFSKDGNLTLKTVKPDPGNGKVTVTLADDLLLSQVGARFVRLGVTMQ